jgi:hypothetical protein
MSISGIASIAASSISPLAPTTSVKSKQPDKANEQQDGGIDFSQLLSLLLEDGQQKKHPNPLQLLNATGASQTGVNQAATGSVGSTIDIKA